MKKKEEDELPRKPFPMGEFLMGIKLGFVFAILIIAFSQKGNK